MFFSSVAVSAFSAAKAISLKASQPHLFAPVPELPAMDGYRNIPVDENSSLKDDALVPLGPFTEYPEFASGAFYSGVRPNSPYHNKPVEGATVGQYVRAGVAEKLRQMNQSLPQGYVIMLLDCYRPLKAQASLHDPFLADVLSSKKFSQSEAEDLTHEYVSLPAPQAPHASGGAVDFALLNLPLKLWKKWDKNQKRLREISSSDEHWKEAYDLTMENMSLLKHASEVDMGVGYDEVRNDAKGRPVTSLGYYETKLAEEGRLSLYEYGVLLNRRLFYNICAQAGFSVFGSETWHVDSGNGFDAKARGLDKKVYGMASWSEDNASYEKMIGAFFAGNKWLAQNPVQAKDLLGKTKGGVLGDVCGSLEKHGDPAQYCPSARHKGQIISPRGLGLI